MVSDRYSFYKIIKLKVILISSISYQNGEQHSIRQLHPGEPREYFREEQREDENVERDNIRAVEGTQG